MGLFKKLYTYRELLKSNIKKEIRGKYKGSFLGVLWSFISPLLMVFVYALVFPFILKVQQPNYVMFLIVGVLPWTFFTTVVNQGTTTVLGNANLIKKVYFPREILPISIATSGLINFLISCVIIVMFLIGTGMGITKYILLFPLVVLVQYIFSLGLTFILSAINVYIRDVEYIVTFLLLMLMYLSPILYSPDMIPAEYRTLFYLNPMAHIIGGYRDVFYYQKLIDFKGLGIVLIFSIALLIIGYRIFKKLEKGFAEEI